MCHPTNWYHFINKKNHRKTARREDDAVCFVERNLPCKLMVLKAYVVTEHKVLYLMLDLRASTFQGHRSARTRKQNHTSLNLLSSPNESCTLTVFLRVRRCARICILFKRITVRKTENRLVVAIVAV